MEQTYPVTGSDLQNHVTTLLGELQLIPSARTTNFPSLCHRIVYSDYKMHY